LFAEGGGYFVPLYARLRVAALIKYFALSVPSPVMPGWVFLVPRRGRNFIRHIKYSVRRVLFRDGGHAFRQEN
jgi:hypothetical protein